MGVARLEVSSTSSRKCFVEDDGTVSLFRRSLAEGVGTAMLMIAVVWSSLHVGSSELSSAMAISGSLIGLILGSARFRADTSIQRSRCCNGSPGNES